MFKLVYPRMPIPIDINECMEGTDTCQRLCLNTIGSYSCDCITGYRLATDGYSCIGM